MKKCEREDQYFEFKAHKEYLCNKINALEQTKGTFLPTVSQHS